MMGDDDKEKIAETTAALKSFQDFFPHMYGDLYKYVGSPEIIFANPNVSARVNFKAKYTIPLDFSHSYDASSPIDENNLPTVQGGLLQGLLDNALTMGINGCSGFRHVATITMSCDFLAPTRPGEVYVEVDVTRVTATVAFANARLFSDEACKSQPTAFATCVNKLRKPSDRSML